MIIWVWFKIMVRFSVRVGISVNDRLRVRVVFRGRVMHPILMQWIGTG